MARGARIRDSQGRQRERSPIADIRQIPRPVATDRRWLFGLAALMVLVTVGVMATAVLGSAVQTGVRAYVGGEGLWSKAEKNAVIHLQRFVSTHDEADWQGYRSALKAINAALKDYYKSF